MLLTVGLVAGAPTLLLDLPKPTTGPEIWGAFSLPATKVEAARWIRAHSEPSDVLLTNEHCWYPNDPKKAGEDCTNNQAFTLSAFSERSVLVEGWGFAPRAMDAGTAKFWDQGLLQANDDAVYHPTADLLGRLHSQYRVRYLVVNRVVGLESPQLKALAAPVYDNGRIGVYELR